MRDPRYWHDAFGFAHRRDAVEYACLGIGILTFPVWGPLWMVGKLGEFLAGLAYDVAGRKP